MVYIIMFEDQVENEITLFKHNMYLKHFSYPHNFVDAIYTSELRKWKPKEVLSWVKIDLMTKTP